MHGNLGDAVSGSRALFCDEQPLPNPAGSNHLEIIGEGLEVQFLLNGRRIFAARRHFEEPFRTLLFTSFCGLRVSNLKIEGDGICPARRPGRKRDKLLLAATVDFGDDVLEAPYTAEMLKILVKRLAGLGMTRIYWLHSHRIRPEVLAPDADPGIMSAAYSGNMLQTIRNCYPFLPKVCHAAYELGMEVYSVHKPFDLGFRPSPVVPNPSCNGRFLDEHPEAMLQRYVPPDFEDTSGHPVRTIKLYKDTARPHGIEPDRTSVWVSDDNKVYTRVADPIRVTLGTERRRFPIYWERGETDEQEVQVITLDGLDTQSKYFAVIYDGPRSFSFANRMYRIAEALDAEGRVVHATRNLPEEPKSGPESWDGTRPFVFVGHAGGRSPSACSRGLDRIERYEALGGEAVGIAFMRVLVPHSRGMPNPGHPESHRFWMDWIQDALDAGVDGVDLRIMNHNPLSDWGNYGFGSIVAEAFRENYGRDLRPDASCRERHMALLGDMYTDFVRRASEVVRSAGKKFSHHVFRPMHCNPKMRGMTNIQWHWRDWIEQGLLDAVTVKNIHVSDNIFDEIMKTADAQGIETIFSPYMNIFFSASATWAQQVSDVLKEVVNAGLQGITFYETASFLRAKKSGDVALHFPGLTAILEPYRS